ncbi:unnamed protein product [Rotaria sordida]|uniref:Uncharacterized protein n=1 Tax=Rotaria sordida TaxID=392033 RepID=A0A819RIN7_9BILA|nr:unnamed protein product [Rotaria sordida]
MIKFFKLIIRKCKQSRIIILYIILSILLIYIITIQYYYSNIIFKKSNSSCVDRIKKDEIFDKFDKFEELYKSSQTLCSKRSVKHGYNQRVISISAYQSNKDNIYLVDKILLYTLEFIVEAKHYYPDWRVGVYYHNLNITNDQIINIEKRFDNVDFCYVYDIKILSNIIEYMSGRFHRFIPLGDPYVDIYMSRDIDSPIYQRELLSVNQWLLSDKLYHIMRDHPHHNDVILAGLWAFKISINRTITNNIIKYLFSKSILNCYNSMRGDQDFLRDYVWPIAEKESIQHDSFHCKLYKFSIPFPKPKLSITQFVGCRRPCRYNQDPPGPCPIKCLPHNYTDQYLC